MQSAQFTAFKISDKSDQALDIKSAIKKYFFHWPLFVITLSISITAAFFYLKTTRPVYEVKATLLIQDEKKAPNQQSPLRELDLVSSAKLVENELEIFKSKQLISQVIEDLKLMTDYEQKVGFLYKDIYNTGPVEFTLIRPSGDYTSNTLNIIIKDTVSFMVLEESGNQKEFFFNNTLNNQFGSWKLEPTKRLKEYMGATIRISISDPENSALYYQKKIGVSIPNKLSTAVVLSIDDHVPQRGKDVLNHLIHSYNLSATVRKNKETKSTLDFLDQRIYSLARELTEAEKGIEQYKSSRGLTDISADSKMGLENLRANDTRLNEVNVQLNVIDGIERYINSSQNTGESPTTFGIEDVRLSGLIEKLSDLQLQRVRLLATTPENNPSFESINRQIAITKAAINENVKNIKVSLLNTRSKLQSYDVDFKSAIRTMPTQEREYVSIKRQQAIKENLYTYLLQKREEIAVSYASTLSEERIVDQAYAGPKKQPQKPIALALALLIGLTIPSALVYRKYHGKITNLQEIKEALKVPVLAELPYDNAKTLIAVNHNFTTPLSEQFRVLRAKLYHLYAGKKSGRITLITSSLPGEGKSFVSTNISIALAYAKRKTIILELDMRKPKIAVAFDIEQDHLGVSDFLNGNASLGDIIQNSQLTDDLDIISRGSIIYDPSELLEGSRLNELIISLADIYDDIIIDSPPLRLVSDAMILSRLANITLYIVRQGVTEKVELEFIRELYEQNQLPAMNIILNGIQNQKYGYGYNYNTSYYVQTNNKRFNGVFADFTERFF